MTDNVRTLTETGVIPGPETLSKALSGAFPAMDGGEQVLALTLYRLLAAAEPVSPEQIARRAGLPIDQVNAVLKNWPGVFLDANRQVVGFWGLSLQETAHRFEVNGKTLYGWCAWDTLFIPALIGSAAKITSSCPVTGKEIRLTVSPEGVESVSPEQLVVSFLLPEKNIFRENIIASFCHYVSFFADSIAAEQWSGMHPGTFILSLEDACKVGRLLNAARYKRTLSQ